MPTGLLQYLPLLIVCVLLIRRTQRPRVIKPGRLWIRPAILLTAAGFYAFAASRSGPALHGADVVIISVTALVGIALGVVRAHSIKLTKHPQSGAIEATLTMWGLAVVFVWIGGRMILRQSGFVGATMPFGVLTDATMALAIGAVLAQAVVLHRRCRDLGQPGLLTS
jgi:NAD/NADP transhydrogenase beta subunit